MRNVKRLANISAVLVAILIAPAFAGKLTYEAVVTADTPCHWWKMQELSGTTLADTEGAACTDMTLSTVTGAPATNNASSGVLNAVSVHFDGSSYYVERPFSSGSGFAPSTNSANTGYHMSWEYWVRLTTSSAFGAPTSSNHSASGGWYMIADDRGGNPSYMDVLDTGQVDVYREAADTGPLTQNNWYHTVFTWDGSASSGTLKVYINGSLKATGTTGTGTCCGSAQYLEIANINGGGSKLTGDLQYVAFYGGPGSNTGTTAAATLTADQVLTHYNAGISPDILPGRRIFQSRAPLTLPFARDENYFSMMVSQGYNTGLFTLQSVQPQIIAAPFLPFRAQLAGNTAALLRRTRGAFK